MNLPDVQERIQVYNEQNELFKNMLLKYTITTGKVIITDLRGVDTIYTGNRFLIYSMFPEQNISVWITPGKGGEGYACAIGHSILNRTSNVDVGSLCLKYHGGGHHKVGTCQFKGDFANDDLQKMLSDLCNMAE